MSASRSRPQRFSDYAIEQRRKEEDARRSILEQSQKESKIKEAAIWEQKSINTIQRNHQQQQVQASINHKLQNVELRRNKLALLLAQDEARYKQEIDGMQETPAQFRERLAARAKELKEAREARRMEVVEEKLHQQWRASKDELRVLDSKALLLHCQEERQQQQEEKHKLKEQDFDMESKWAKLWEWDRLQKQKREEEELQQRKLADARTKDVIDQQMDEIRQRKEQERRAREEETRRMLELQRQEAEAAAAAELQHQKNKRLAQLETMRFNSEYQATKERRLREERELEAKITQAAAQKDAEEKEAQANRKARLREDMFSYMGYLTQLREDQKFMDAELERLRQIEQDAAFQRRQVQWEKEHQARVNLLQDVKVTREQQIAQREQSKRLERQSGLSERQKIVEELSRLEEAEKQKEFAVVQSRLQNKQFLLQQVDDKQKAKETEREAQLRQAMELKAREDQMKDQLEKELATIQPKKPQFALKSTKWYT